MVKTKAELLDAVKNMLTDSTTDEALALIEDVSDTIDSYTSQETENWEEKYKELDKSWREKYRDRFFSGGTAAEEPDEQDEPDPEEHEKKSFDELFTTEK